MSKDFTAIPAIDVRQSRVVRLRQGDYAQETRYDDSPADLARKYAAAGSRWLHLVDLDAAKAGGYTLLPLLAQLCGCLQIQTGGGIRSAADIEAVLAGGATRVVIGTLAVREPERVIAWLHDYGSERVVIALDARQDADGEWQLPVAGWTEKSDQTLIGLLGRYADAGLRHVLCTDIERDGMLGGFNLDLYRLIAQRWPQLQLQASGGVRSLDDIRAAKVAGASVAILGRALLEGKFDLPEALAC